MRAIEVYTDGQCPLCRWVRARIEPRDRYHRIEWLDYHDHRVRQQLPFTPAELAAEMHVRVREDGRWAKGFEAWLEVLRVLPRGWRWLGRLLSLPPGRVLGPLFYRWVARRRYRIFGVPPTCEANGAYALPEPKP